MLPGIDGFRRRRRACARAGQFVPVLMLTARGRPEDVLRRVSVRRRRLSAEAVRAADPHRAGAGPAAPARVVPARPRPPAHGAGRRRAAFVFRERTIDFEQLEVHMGDKTMPLTLMEASLLRYLVEHEGQPGVAQNHSREGVGRARRHRHARHRQLHRAAAPLLEDEPASPRTSRPSAASAIASWRILNDKTRARRWRDRAAMAPASPASM